MNQLFNVDAKILGGEDQRKVASFKKDMWVQRSTSDYLQRQDLVDEVGGLKATRVL